MDESEAPRITERPPAKSWGPTEAVWLALFPLFGTCLAFVFKAGFYSFYGIPSTLIELDINAIVTSTSALLVLFALYSNAIFMTADLLSAERPELRAIGEGILLFVLISPLPMLGGEKSSAIWAVLSCASLMAIAWNFASPLMNKDQTLSYKQKMLARSKRTTSLRDDMQSGKTFANRVIGPAASVVLLLTVIVFLTGKSVASNNTQYWADEKNPAFILVGMKGDIAILREVTGASGDIGDEIRLSPIAELKLRSVHIETLEAWSPRISTEK